MEVSIVLPALNEEKSIGKTIREIKSVLSRSKVQFEVIVVDSDSEDRTVDIARKEGAKVINEPKRGYGNALRKGFGEAKGKYIIMYDPDGSYDANTLPLMIKTLKEGYDYVNGNRLVKLNLKSMSLGHYIGNKIINFLGNFFFHVKAKDMLSGYKGFRAEALKRLNLRAEKWDLNVEIQSKTKKNKIKFKEVPTLYFSRMGESKLSATTAAWNNLRFMLMYSPNFVFIYPSIAFMLAGFLMTMHILIVGGLGHASLILFNMIFIIGLQVFLFGVTAKNYLFKKGLEEKNILSILGSELTLEKGVVAGLILFMISFVIFLFILVTWLTQGKTLYLSDLKIGILGFTVFMTSISIVTYSFMNQILEE